MSSVGLTKTEIVTLFEGSQRLLMESGEYFGPIEVAYETYGKLNSAAENAILILHALTGDAHAAGVHSANDKVAGWWDQMVGPGRVFDTNKYFVICSNVLGSCYGTTGPASINPSTGQPYGLSLPVVTIRDMVNVQRQLLDYLGVKRLVSVVGGSMGGMQALEWAISFPDFIRSAVSIAASGRLSPQGIAYNQVQRMAIMGDPGWNQGQYYGVSLPSHGLSLARMIATITYKSDQSWNAKFGRALSNPGSKLYCLESCFEVENYLLYQGNKLVKRFDANSYLYLLKAMDLFDVGRGRESFEKALSLIDSYFLSIGISSDILYPTYQQKELVQILRRLGKNARYAELDSPYGHDAFLIEFKQMGQILEKFLASLD
ncbi:MAG: homoserine O-acetyltransferase MetX [Bacillota bacterium]